MNVKMLYCVGEAKVLSISKDHYIAVSVEGIHVSQ